MSILELLANNEDGLSAADIGAALGLSHEDTYAELVAMESRGEVRVSTDFTDRHKSSGDRVWELMTAGERLIEDVKKHHDCFAQRASTPAERERWRLRYDQRFAAMEAAADPLPRCMGLDCKHARHCHQSLRGDAIVSVYRLCDHGGEMPSEPAVLGGKES